MFKAHPFVAEIKDMNTAQPFGCMGRGQIAALSKVSQEADSKLQRS